MLYFAVTLFPIAVLVACCGLGIIAAYSWDDDEAFAEDDDPD